MPPGGVKTEVEEEKRPSSSKPKSEAGASVGQKRQLTHKSDENPNPHKMVKRSSSGQKQKNSVSDDDDESEEEEGPGEEAREAKEDGKGQVKAKEDGKEAGYSEDIKETPLENGYYQYEKIPGVIGRSWSFIR